jgi:hypothetical protein
MLRSTDNSIDFFTRYLWTACVLVLVVGGLLVAMSRANAERPGMDGARLAGHTTPLMR